MAHVERLGLRDFRCHDSLTFCPERGVNVLLGPNGAGKTSILEAIAYASVLRSFRDTPGASLVHKEATEGIVRLGFFSKHGEGRIEIEIPREGRRRVQLNGKRPTSNASVARSFPTVAFLPDDLDLIKGSPGVRRDFLDVLAGQLSPQAGAALKEYARALRQRNALLRQEGWAVDITTLSVWDERLADAGAEVVAHRMGLMSSLEPLLQAGYESVASQGRVRVRYRPSWAMPADAEASGVVRAALLEALEACRGHDMDLRVTSVGPHRDEPWLELNERPARSEASQGEQRSLAIGLRLASYSLLEARTGRTPVLLLDDVFSELDPHRARGVMELLPRGQVFVTSARQGEVPVSGRRWVVSVGSIL